MNLKNQPPIWVPLDFKPELEKLSKAALMDMVWDFAFQISGGNMMATINEIRNRSEIILIHRHAAKHEREHA